MADPYEEFMTPEEAYAGFMEDPAPAVPIRREPVLGPRADAFALSGAGALPGGGLFTDLVSAALARTWRPDGSVDPAFAATFPHLASGAAAFAPLFRKGGARFTPEGEAAMAEQGTPVEAPAARSMVEDYRDTRDTRRLREAQGRREEPGWARGGATAALVASVLAPGSPAIRLGGNTARGRVASGAATGALYGGAAGALDGEADLTRGEVSRAAQDVGTGALGGLLVGGAASGAVEAARPLLINPLRRLAIGQGKQTIQGGSDIAAATREPLADDAVEEVLRSGAIRPMSTTQATAERIEALARTSGDEYSRIVAELEARGVSGPEATRVADELVARAARLEPRTLNDALPAELLHRAEQVIGKAGNQPRLGLTQAEDLKRSMQDMARYGKLEETPLNAVRREVASVLRQANEDAVETAGQVAGPASPIRALADRFVPVKQRTGRLLEAERFAQKGASKAEQRSPVSFKDLLLGSTTGEPVSALALSAGSSIARNRLPSTVAANAYGLSEGLRTGAASPELARILSLVYEDDVRGTTAEALAEILRTRKAPQ